MTAGVKNKYRYKDRMVIETDTRINYLYKAMAMVLMRLKLES